MPTATRGWCCHYRSLVLFRATLISVTQVLLILSQGTLTRIFSQLWCGWSIPGFVGHWRGTFCRWLRLQKAPFSGRLLPYHLVVTITGTLKLGISICLRLINLLSLICKSGSRYNSLPLYLDLILLWYCQFLENNNFLIGFFRFLFSLWRSLFQKVES